MKLIGMLDSPYVRRVAISFQLMGLKFEHQSLSVFRTYEAFRRISPVVKAPTLVCDDGTPLLDSTLILEYGAALATVQRSLLPRAPRELQRTLYLVGLALAACEKSVQVVYERNLRPADKQHEPWLQRVTEQMLTAYGELEREFALGAPGSTSDTIDQAGVSTAVAWEFTQRMLPADVPALQFPTLAAYCHLVEKLPEFLRAPYGDATYPVADGR